MLCNVYYKIFLFMNRKIYSGTPSLDYFIIKGHLFGKKLKV